MYEAMSTFRFRRCELWYFPIGRNGGIGWLCLSSASFSILVNDSPYGYFKISRGLRQEGLLSPLFLILVMEALAQGFEVGQVVKGHVIAISNMTIIL